jgi:hypothetical protein
MGQTARNSGPKMIAPTGGNEWKRGLASWMREANRGKFQAIGQVTLTANARSTRVEDSRAGPDSFIGLSPTNTNAAQEKSRGTLYVSQQGKGYFVISHQENALDDRTFNYTIMG